MKLFPIVFFHLAVVCLDVAVGDRDGICNSQQTTTTKLLARRTWPIQFAITTTTTTAKPTTVTTTSSPSTSIAVQSTRAPTTASTTTTTTPLPISFNCSVSDPVYGGSETCGTNMCTNVTSGGGVVQSPNFPADYSDQERTCEVTIVVPTGKKIHLKFTTFNLETDNDNIYVDDGEAGITGSKIPAAFTTLSNILYLRFESFTSIRPKTTTYSWQATYTAV